jgi:hypothetical protein
MTKSLAFSEHYSVSRGQSCLDTFSSPVSSVFTSISNTTLGSGSVHSEEPHSSGPMGYIVRLTD